MSKSPILRFPIPFDEEFTEKGYWPFAVVELPEGLYYSVYFAQICSIDCNPYFAPPGLIIVPEVTIKSMETTIQKLYEGKQFFEYLTPLEPGLLLNCQPEKWSVDWSSHWPPPM